jgi:hypothetical protein
MMVSFDNVRNGNLKLRINKNKKMFWTGKNFVFQLSYWFQGKGQNSDIGSQKIRWWKISRQWKVKK